MYLRFGYIPYPRWRRRWPGLVKIALNPLWERLYPVAEDDNPPPDPAAMADTLLRFGLMPDMTLREIRDALRDSRPQIADTRDLRLPPMPEQPVRPVRIPAQWEPMESIIVNWPVMYPPLWPLHAQMVEAIAPVAQAVITVPAPMWAHAAWLYLRRRGLLGVHGDQVRFMVIPTDDIWVRDHGPIIGLDADGQQVAFDAIYDHLPNYPQERDNAMTRYWAAQTETTLHPLNLHTEGGNLWSDGLGTLIMTEQIFYENRHLDRSALETYLHSVIDYEKLIITPRIYMESTGHVDLLLKLADPTTVLVSSARAELAEAPLRETVDIFRRETNARGERYTVVELPTPRLYFNWFVYPIRRSYTNALTVNGRVLVPVYGIRHDDTALRIYEQTMPGYTVIPIDCSIGANGGGAVHCMTKEVPAAR
ncbi:MAG: agmatine deiminase family protein [Chloroflexota bacterium]